MVVQPHLGSNSPFNYHDPVFCHYRVNQRHLTTIGLKHYDPSLWTRLSKCLKFEPL